MGDGGAAAEVANSGNVEGFDHDGDAPGAADSNEAARPAGQRDAPEQWDDTKMTWRHPNTFVFVLNGPLTYFHPDARSRNVCPYLAKVPRSGPSNAERLVNEADSRRVQRLDSRDRQISEVNTRNESVIAELREARQVQAQVAEAQVQAATDANRLQQIHLEMEVAARQQQWDPMAPIKRMSVALELLEKLSDLSASEIEQRNAMRCEMIQACLNVNTAANPFDQIATRLSSMSRPSGSYSSPQVATVPRVQPMNSLPSNPQGRRENSPVIVALAGGGVRDVRRNLHPTYAIGAVGAVADDDSAAVPEA
jgi:hypothetical protein